MSSLHCESGCGIHALHHLQRHPRQSQPCVCGVGRALGDSRRVVLLLTSPASFQPCADVVLSTPVGFAPLKWKTWAEAPDWFWLVVSESVGLQPYRRTVVQWSWREVSPGGCGTAGTDEWHCWVQMCWSVIGVTCPLSVSEGNTSVRDNLPAVSRVRRPFAFLIGGARGLWWGDSCRSPCLQFFSLMTTLHVHRCSRCLLAVPRAARSPHVRQTYVTPFWQWEHTVPRRRRLPVEQANSSFLISSSLKWCLNVICISYWLFKRKLWNVFFIVNVI